MNNYIQTQSFNTLTSLYPAHKKTSWIVSRRPAARNHLWHRSFGSTSTSTSCNTVGTVLWPCLVRPQPATVAIFPVSFTCLPGRQTGRMCCLKTTTLSSLTCNGNSRSIQVIRIIKLWLWSATYQRNVVPEVSGRVTGMHLFPLNAVLLVVQPLILISDVPFSEAHL